MDFLTLRAVLAECRALRGQSIAAVTPLDMPPGLALHFAPSGLRLRIHPLASPCLFLEAGGGGGRPAGEIRTDDLLAGVAAPLQPLLRALHERFVGGRLAAVETAGMSRVAIFTFERRDRLGDPVTLTLVVELIGAFGNLILLDGPPVGGRILERLQADRRRQDPRPLGRGAAWRPPAARGTDLLLEGPAALTAALAAAPLPADAAGWSARLKEVADGVSPALARELVAGAGTPMVDAAFAAALVSALETRLAAADAAGPAAAGAAPAAPDVPTRIGSASARVFEALQGGPGGAEGGAGREGAAGPAGAPREPGGASVERHALHQAVEIRCTDAGRRLERLRHELERRPDGESDRRRGEALLAYAHDVPRSASAVTLPIGDDETPTLIALDPRRTAAENAANYFREARKAERAAEEMPAKVRAAEAQLERLLGFRRRLAALPAGDAEGLAGLQAEWRGAPLPPRRGGGTPGAARATGHRAAPGGRGAAGAPPLGGSAARGPRAPTAAMQPKRYDMPGGWVILVGRSEIGNDYLTHELAAPHDLWFHAHGCAGSHVVLKGPDKKAEPDKSLILAAAALAALNSKARHAAKVPVTCAEKRHVRKPRGGKPGLAIVTHEKSIMVRPAEPAVREEA